MATSRFADHLLTGTHASRPAATAVPVGTLYSCTTHGLIYQSDGATWSTYATLGSTETLPATIIDAKGDLIAGTAADTAARLAVGSDGQILTADAASTPGVKWATPAGSSGGMTKIFDSTLGSAATNIDSGAGSIAGTYAALKIVAILRASETVTASGGLFRINNDSASNYGSQWVRGLNATASASNTNSAGGFNLLLPGASCTSGYFAHLDMTILGYAQTSLNKFATWDLGFVDPTTFANSYRYASAGVWPSTAAITRVAIFSNGFNLITGSRLVVWGLN